MLIMPRLTPLSISFVIVATALFVSCSLLEPSAVDVPAGIYSGSYTMILRDTATSKITQQTAGDVTLEVKSDKQYVFTPKYSHTLAPPASSGVFTLVYRKITFSDRSPTGSTTATNSELLKGDYEYTFDGQNLVMTQKDDARMTTRQFFLLRGN